MEFYKFHGTGNDFIMIDNREGDTGLSTERVRALCDRRFGIGADGLILLEDDEACDIKMVYYNSDGNESTMCGNGGRCLAAFANLLSLVEDVGTLRAIDGIHSFTIIERVTDTWTVRLGMSDVSVSQAETSGEMIVDTGSPHFVIKVDDPVQMEIIEQARLIRYSDRFRSEGINVNFIREDSNGITIRTYERGVEDETLSCGTGCVAAAISAGSDNSDGSYEYDIITKGGKVKVSYTKSGKTFSDVYLTGPATMTFMGITEL